MSTATESVPAAVPAAGAVEAPVILTESAAREIANMRDSDPENQGKSLRVYVEAGGCSGLSVSRLHRLGGPPNRS